jgi:hypothetical protein
MGQDPDELREAIEDTRRRMDDTVVALGRRIDVRSRVRERVRSIDWPRLVPYAAGAVATIGGAVTTIVVFRMRASAPPERLAVPVKRLPSPARDVTLPWARGADRMLARTGEAIGEAVAERRDRALQTMSREIARALAEEQERRNPWWVRMARDTGGAAATTAATMMVRRMLSSRAQQGQPQQQRPAGPESMERVRSFAGG